MKTFTCTVLLSTLLLSGCADAVRFAGEAFTATLPAASGAKIVWVGQAESTGKLGVDYRGDHESTDYRHIKKGRKLTLHQGDCVGIDIVGYGLADFMKVLLLPSVKKDGVVLSQEKTMYPVTPKVPMTFGVCFNDEPNGKYIINVKINDAANTQTFDETSIAVTLLK